MIVFQGLLHQVVREQPDNPFEYFHEEISKIKKEMEESNVNSKYSWTIHYIIIMIAMCCSAIVYWALSWMFRIKVPYVRVWEFSLTRPSVHITDCFSCYEIMICNILSQSIIIIINSCQIIQSGCFLVFDCRLMQCSFTIIFFPIWRL